MENGNIRHDSCRWLIPNDIDGNCPLSDSRNVPTIKKKKNRHHYNKTTNRGA